MSASAPRSTRCAGSWQEFRNQVEFFVASAYEYHFHFLLFPELFTAQLFSTMDPTLEERRAIENLAAEADPNVETVAVTDLDLGDLALQRELGSVRPLRDRRPDLYSLHGHPRVELIRTV